MTRVCSKFCSVRAYLRSPVWFGSPSSAHTPSLPCSEMRMGKLLRITVLYEKKTYKIPALYSLFFNMINEMGIKRKFGLTSH